MRYTKIRRGSRQRTQMDTAKIMAVSSKFTMTAEEQATAEQRLEVQLVVENCAFIDLYLPLNLKLL